MTRPTVTELRALNPHAEIWRDADGVYGALLPSRKRRRRPLQAPSGYLWRPMQGVIATLERQTTPADVARWIRLYREPWREYFPYRPDDFPPPGGNPAAPARLSNDPECGYEG